MNEKVVGFYEKWSEKAAADPVWAKANPMKIHVSRLDSGELDVRFNRRCKGKTMRRFIQYRVVQ